MIILFPSEPFSNLKEVDSSFKNEYDAAELIGFQGFLFDHDEFVRSGKFKNTLPVIDGNAKQILLRSWMLKEDEYKKLWSQLFALGYILTNSANQYVQCHHLPEAYRFIDKYTTKIWWSNTWSEHPGFNNTAEVEWEPVRRMLGGDIIIKDYVKSEKGNADLFILNKELTNEEFAKRVQRFIDARGKLFNKGLVFKEVVSLKKYNNYSNEWRMFFANNKLVTVTKNSEIDVDTSAPDANVIETFSDLAKKIPSAFFTIDIAEREDGSWVILEVGDGQVSGLAAQEEPIKFYNNLFNILTGQEVE